MVTDLVTAEIMPTFTYLQKREKKCVYMRCNIIKACVREKKKIVDIL